MNTQTLSTIEALGRQTSVVGVINLIDRVIDDHGFERIVVSGVGPGKSPLVELSTLPEGWLEHYRSRNYFAVDPVARRSIVATRPFDWSDVPFDEESSRTVERIAAEGREYGLTTGYSVPIVNASGGRTTFSFVGKERTDSSRRPELHLLALYAHEQVRLISSKQKPGKHRGLTAREIEVLRWVAMGKSASDIATIMNMSERTVNQHCENAQRRLRTSNRVHTVVEAIRQGYVQF